MAEKASRGRGVGPVHSRLRHLIQINNDVARVTAIATESISYIAPNPRLLLRASVHGAQ